MVTDTLNALGGATTMADFMKIDPAFAFNAKIRAAGIQAGWLFLAVLGVNTLGHRDGCLPPHEAVPEHLAWRSGMKAGAVRRAIERCVTARLLKVEPDGSLRIVGWEDTWRPAL